MNAIYSQCSEQVRLEKARDFHGIFLLVAQMSMESPLLHYLLYHTVENLSTFLDKSEEK